MNPSFCETRMLSWLSGLLDRQRFDKVICVERKATAMVRALLDLSESFSVDWDWSGVLSSDALPFLPDGHLNAQRVLVFNEMIHRGGSSRKTIDAVLSNSPNVKRIESAAFIVHEDCESKDVPNYAVHRSASKRFYTFTRQQMIEMLKSKGALMLDTEHLETTFRLDVPFRELVDALCSFGEPIVYQNDAVGAFPGVTVRQPVVEDTERLRSLLPPGTGLEDSAPKKVRLVRRGPHEFAFIPIWYPQIEVEGARAYVASKSVPKYIRRALDKCPSGKIDSLVFHLSSLVAGLELIRSVWAGLAPLVEKGIRPNFPGSKGFGATLGHIRALYPLLDFAELETVLRSAISTYKRAESVNRIHSATGWRPRSKKGLARIASIDADTIEQQCIKLLSSIIDSRDELFVEEERWFTENEGKKSGADLVRFTWSEFWETGERLGIEQRIRSVLMDRAIDSAVLKTGDCMIQREDRAVLVRGYEPDSEYALHGLRRTARGAQEVTLYG
jgi:hypothetical protein